MSVYTNPSFSAPGHSFQDGTEVLELLGARDPLAVLEALPVALANEITGLSIEELQRPEAPGKWSMLEVIQHLADVELVWAYRLRLILSEDRPHRHRP